MVGNYNFLSDIDECSTGVDKCDANAYCTNTVGSYKCTCEAGYVGNGFKCTGKLHYSAIIYVIITLNMQVHACH